MPIEVCCDNIVRYDHQASQYVRCRHRFSTADDLAGGEVVCPECGNTVPVPLPKPAGLNAPPPSPLDNPEAEPLSLSPEGDTQAPLELTPSDSLALDDDLLGSVPDDPLGAGTVDPLAIPLAVDSVDEMPIELTPVDMNPDASPEIDLASLEAGGQEPPSDDDVVDISAISLETPDDAGATPFPTASDTASPDPLSDLSSLSDSPPLSDPTPLAIDDLADIAPVTNDPLTLPESAGPTEFPATEQQPPPAKFGMVCTKCGAPMDQDRLLCEACGFHEGMGRYLDGWNETEEPPAETGFRYWLSEQLAEGESIATMLYLGWAVISLVMLLFVTWLIVIMGWWSASFLYPIYFGGVVLTFLFVLRVTGKRQAGKSFFWSMMLVAARASGWRSLSWPFRRLALGDYYRTELTDEDLRQREDLADLEVLDLEGTKITDEILDHIRRMPKLACLVLTRTDVTAEAVEKLQQARPHVWIWIS